MFVDGLCETVFVEGGVVLGRDVLVGARLQREDGRLHLAGSVSRAGRAVTASRKPVETDGACETVPAGRGDVRRTSGRTTTPTTLGSSGVAANAASRLPSRASRTRSWCETAAPAIAGIDGSESNSKHTAKA